MGRERLEEFLRFADRCRLKEGGSPLYSRPVAQVRQSARSSTSHRREPSPAPAPQPPKLIQDHQRPILEVIAEEAKNRPPHPGRRPVNPERLAAIQERIRLARKLGAKDVDKIVEESKGEIERHAAVELRELHSLPESVKTLIERGDIPLIVAYALSYLPSELRALLADAYVARVISHHDLRHRTMHTGRIAYLRACLVGSKFKWPAGLRDLSVKDTGP